MTSFPFSVVMSVYKNDKAEFVALAIDSVIEQQTVKPSEVILVVDGPIGEALKNLLLQYEKKYADLLRILWQEKNTGLGNVLRIGVEAAKCELIARMDSDDISVPDRFEKQLAYFRQDESLAIVGGQMTEFIDSPSNIVGCRQVPLGHEQIAAYMKSRCPLNHMTVMFRKQAVLAAGSYRDWHYNEDYYLWIRMSLAGCRFKNDPNILCNVRVGHEMYARRGGWKYFKSEAGIQNLMWREGYISMWRYLFNVSVRLCLQVLMPNSVRGFIFRKLLRRQHR